MRCDHVLSRISCLEICEIASEKVQQRPRSAREAALRKMHGMNIKLWPPQTCGRTWSRLPFSMLPRTTYPGHSAMPSPSIARSRVTTSALFLFHGLVKLFVFTPPELLATSEASTFPVRLAI